MMKKRVLSVLLSLGMLMSLLPGLAFAAPGDSVSDPILISTAQELAALATSTDDYTGKYVKLTADIDLSAVCGAGKGDWTPIGSDTESFNGFCGTFDGDGHTVRNLYIHESDGSQGLFWQIGEAGTVKNLTVTGRLDSGSPLGGIAGINYGRVENCDNECTIETTGISGGIVGQNEGVVENCRNAGTVAGKEAGGIVGRHRDGTVRDCDNTGVISCKYVDSTNPLDIITVYVGGIVGTASSSKPVVERCSNAGLVEADAGTHAGDVNLFIGGVAGENLGTIQNCYNTVSVTVSEFSCAGGVVGKSMSGSTVKNCYGFGSISASGYVGGVIGNDWNSTITSAYYDSSKDPDGNWQTNGTGIPTADFANQSTFVGWDFDAVWAMDPAQGRPVFQRQLTSSHSHIWAGEWNKTDTHHWHECTAEDCPVTEDSQKDGYATHSYSGWQTADGRHWQVCTECGYESAREGHTWDSGSVTQAATETDEGELTYTCTLCAATKTEAIPKLGTAVGVVEVKPDTPAATVDETVLQEVAEAEKADDKSVTVKLTVEAVEAPADKDEIQGVAAEQTVDFLDLTLTKTTVEGNTTSTDPITDTGDKVLEIAVPFDFTNKTDVTVYRKHSNEAAAALTEADTKADGTFRLEGSGKSGKVYIYTSKFSTYAIGYTETEEEVKPKPGSSGGSYYIVYYTLTATAGEGGRIQPSGRVSLQEYQSKTFTVTPEEGYEIGDVLVDGESVGAVESYTFEQVRGDHTIAVSFRETAAGESVCPKDETCPVAAFSDADPAAWYHDGVHYCLENDLMEGCGKGIFSPDGTLTRAMLARILYNMAGQPAVTGDSPFADVAPEAWYAGAVIWAAGEGVVKGYDTGLFGPEDAITREQLAVMLWRYAQATGEDVSGGEDADLLNYKDADRVSAYALPALRWAVGSGIVNGKGGELLDPTGSATRAEAAAMLQRSGEAVRE